MVRATRTTVLFALTAGTLAMFAALPASASIHHFTSKELLVEQTISIPEVASGSVDTVVVDDAYWDLNKEYRLIEPPTTVSDIVWVRNNLQRAWILFASDNESGGFPATYTQPDTSAAGRQDFTEGATLTTVVHTGRNAFGAGTVTIQISFSSDADPSSGISDILKIQVIHYVPNLQTWGLISLTLLLLIGGAWFLVRQQGTPDMAA